jgi:hypothetical protein
VYFNDHGTIGPDPTKSIPGGYDARIADVNNDRLPDVLLLEARSVAVLFGRGGGELDQPIRFVVGYAPQQLDLADFDRNGLPDIAVANQETGTIEILFNRCTP